MVWRDSIVFSVENYTLITQLHISNWSSVISNRLDRIISSTASGSMSNSTKCLKPPTAKSSAIIRARKAFLFSRRTSMNALTGLLRVSSATNPPIWSTGRFARIRLMYLAPVLSFSVGTRISVILSSIWTMFNSGSSTASYPCHPLENLFLERRTKSRWIPNKLCQRLNNRFQITLSNYFH